MQLNYTNRETTQINIIKGTIIAALLMTAFVLAPGMAYAGESCADGIKKASDRLESSGKFNTTISGVISEAKEALAAGKKETCERKVKRATKLMDKKGL